MKEKIYVTHTCKRCGRAFVAEDTANVQDVSSKSKYCDECVKLGYKNKQKREFTQEQIEAFKERMKKVRERRM